MNTHLREHTFFWRANSSSESELSDLWSCLIPLEGVLLTTASLEGEIPVFVASSLSSEGMCNSSTCTSVPAFVSFAVSVVCCFSAFWSSSAIENGCSYYLFFLLSALPLQSVLTPLCCKIFLDCLGELLHSNFPDGGLLSQLAKLQVHWNAPRVFFGFLGLLHIRGLGNGCRIHHASWVSFKFFIEVVLPAFFFRLEDPFAWFPLQICGLFCLPITGICLTRFGCLLWFHGSIFVCRLMSFLIWGPWSVSGQIPFLEIGFTSKQKAVFLVIGSTVGGLSIARFWLLHMLLTFFPELFGYAYEFSYTYFLQCIVNPEMLWYILTQTGALAGNSSDGSKPSYHYFIKSPALPKN